MKHTLLYVLITTCLFASSPAFGKESTPPPLLPLPNSYQATGGTREAPANVTFSYDDAIFKQTAATCAQWRPAVKTEAPSLKVRFVKKQGTGPEAYSLTVLKSGDVLIEASAPTGAFYGFQTLFQLMHSEGGIPCCTISDAPRFGWRGLMLDEARHFMGKDYVKHLLRTMAAHKMNRFHWHLTDDQGWRIEIKKYPKLTSVGAWRGPGTKAPVPKWDKENEHAKQKYGGFYTQDDIREIVAYAKSLHIEILPEIDVPGHAMAIALSYPEVLPSQDKETGKGVHGLSGNVLSVVRKHNYRMLDDIFGEISALFPFPYLHVGGDEVNHNAWNASPEHRKHMEQHKMNAGQLQNMFMLRLEKILKGHSKTLMGWNEIMHGGKLSNDTGVMAWISIDAGLHAARNGYPTVMAVGPHNYFDMKYPGAGETGHWWAGIIDTRRAYSWNPLFEGKLDAKQQKNILGVHCCLWTEFVPDAKDADYKLWPRACATAEVGWTQQKKRDWTQFETRLAHHLDLLDTMKVGYRVRPPQAIQSQGDISFPINPGGKILYTLDGTEPLPATAKIYAGETIAATHLNKIRYRTLRPNQRMSKVISGAIREPVARWSSDTLKKEKVTLQQDVTATLTKSGNWFIEAHYRGGKHPVKVSAVRLLQDGREVSRVPGSEVSKDKRVLRMRLPLEKILSGSRYELQIALEGKAGSKGHFIFDRSPWLEPVTTVTTEVPHFGNSIAAQAANWVRSDWFWSNRVGKKGDTWLYTFGKPVLVSNITLPSGKPDSNTDIVVDGVIEVSEDGKSFAQAGSFAYGTGSAKFDKPKRIKAIRLRLDKDHSTWIILRDLEIK